MSILGRKINEEIKTAKGLREIGLLASNEKSMEIRKKQFEIDEKVKFLQGLDKAIEEGEK